jgi:hypothetical protein
MSDKHGCRSRDSEIELEGARVIQPGLQIGINVLRVSEVNLGYSERGMPQPSTYIHQIYAIPQPSRRTSLSQPM